MENNILYCSKNLLKTFRNNQIRRLLAYSMKKPNNTTIQHIRFDFLPKQEILDTATAIGSELYSRDQLVEVKDEQGNVIKPVGFYMSNRREWTILDVACILYGFTSCPFYDTLGLNSIQYRILDIQFLYSLEQTQVSICFVQSSTIKVLIDINQPNLKTIVIVGDGFNNEDLEKLRIQGKEIVTWDQILQRGKNNLIKYPNLQPNISMTLIFTSGTTGQPKGVLQTQQNFQNMMAIFDYHINQKFTENDVYLSYLPLPHIFERVIHLGALLGLAEINYYSGNIQNLARDIQRCKPTYKSIKNINCTFVECLECLIDFMKEYKMLLLLKIKIINIPICFFKQFKKIKFKQKYYSYI